MWQQTYDPLGAWPLSTAVAALPVFVLIGLLLTNRVRAYQAALAGLLTAVVLALWVFGMPARLVASSVALGFGFALFRIVWLIVAAVFLYDVIVHTGAFETIRASIASLSRDRRLQAVLVAFCFGAFIEGTSGFGAPVAISAAILVGLGFPPLQASVLCLVANTAPVAWGSIGIPITTLAKVTELDVHALSATAGRILPPISFLIPFWLVKIMTSWGGLFAVWPVLLGVGLSFALTQWAWSNFVGVELVDLASSVASLITAVVLLKVWSPREVQRFESDVLDEGPAPKLSKRAVVRAWFPFVLLSLIVMVWGIPAIKGFLDQHTSWKVEMPGLHGRITKGPELVGDPSKPQALDATLDIVPITATGTAVFLTAVVSGLVLGCSPRRLAELFLKTLRRLGPAATSIFAMLGLGFLTRYSGMDAVLGLAFARTNVWLYPIFGTLLGWLGVALTGSDTSSNILFGNLQVITSEKLKLNPILMASANSTGGVMGKMIDAQSIVVAAAATGVHGQEGTILRAVFRHSLILVLLVAAVVWFYAHVAPGWIPTVPPK